MKKKLTKTLKRKVNVRNVGTNGANKPTVISTFAGCGGSSLGYKWAGFKELLAIDFDKNAVETFKLNFKEVPIWQRDIKTITAKEILDFCKIKKGELDVLDGSPPCQGFSTAGKRKVTDDRNDLFKEYIRLIEGLQPKVFVMENVSGMIKGKMKGRFIEIMKDLKATEYDVKCKLMNAMYYQVPQSRERLIFVGTRKDIRIEPTYPKGSSELITPKMAFCDCPKDEPKSLPEWLQKAAKYIDAGNYNHKSVLKAFLLIKGTSGGSQNTKLLTWDRVSCTLIKSEIADTGIIHPNRKRYLTIAEMKRLGSFPDDYIFIGSRKEKVGRIGNSVPPKFMEAIARNIKANILN